MSEAREATIFALSTAGLPSAIAIVRVSGPESGSALEALTGALPAPRRASFRRVYSDGNTIDDGLVLWFPGPDSATGEDIAEFHIHGSRAVAARLLDCLAAMPGLRAAKPGEFTRRAFENGRIDLSAAEGLGDLLAAETEMQRRHALRIAEGGLAAKVEAWRQRLLVAEARLEAVLNFSDEGDVDAEDKTFALEEAFAVADEIGDALSAPPAERMRDGVRVVLAGPPNSGKSTLFNALLAREAAIVSEQAGTTRDVLEAAIDLDGVPVLLFDTAGLRKSAEAIEEEGVRRAHRAAADADVLVWLGEEQPSRGDALWVYPMADRRGAKPDDNRLPVSAVTGSGMANLTSAILSRAHALLPRDDQLALNRRQSAALGAARATLATADGDDWVILAETLRLARVDLDVVSGRAGVEDMLDALFGRFCIGK